MPATSFVKMPARLPWSVLLLLVVSACAPRPSAEEGDSESVASAREPLSWAPQQTLVASDGTHFARFGTAVSVSGDTLIVGAYTDDDKGMDSGSAYVFVRKDATWGQQAKLVPADGKALDTFGFAVAVSGDTAVAGSDTSDNGPHAGGAYVFTRTGTSWTQQAKLLAPDGLANDRMGTSVAIDGDTIVVGAVLHQGLEPKSGAVHVFVRSGQTWTAQAELLASDGAQGDSFGRAVSIAGDTVVVGAPNRDEGGKDAGAAYVFVRNGATWKQEAKLLASDGAGLHNFGMSVALAEDRLLVGAPGNQQVIVTPGAAYVFTRAGAGWVEQAKLSSGDGMLGDLFGISVALSGDTAAVGTLRGFHTGVKGAAYLLTRKDTTWTQQAELYNPTGTSGDAFGASVTATGSTVIAGAPSSSTQSAKAGAAFVLGFVLDPGEACMQAAQCGTGHCADGVCCDTACDEAGTACTAAKKGSGEDGVCGPAAQGSSTGSGGSGSETGSGGPPGERSYYSCQASPGETGSPLLWLAALVSLFTRRAPERRARRGRGPS